MARVYTLKREARKLDRIRVIYLTQPDLDFEELKEAAPLLSPRQLRLNWFHMDEDDVLWSNAVKRVIREVAMEAIAKGIGPQKLVIHILDQILPIELRAWMYRYEVADDEEAPFFVKLVTHETMRNEWVITGRYNL